ncbi:unnamed protein product, partial [Soboliphyme baturini]|uniref:Cytochrome b561 domain-containing protein n=1 Tax=Soboliphyme baturini TaxID=241478 RepID=A0A183J5M8_9BILA
MSIVLDRYDALEEQQDLHWFKQVFVLSQTFGITSVILIALWMGNYDGGYGWSDQPDQMFHYHPLLMSIGLLFVFGEAILIYRVFRYERKMVTKLAHAILHTIVFTLIVIALHAVFTSHQLNRVPNLYSLHSWVGLSVVLLFSMQYLCGLVTFLFPGLSLPTKQWYLPIHQVFGVVIFVAASATALMGISERA